jgi:hypothetical protein
MAREVEVGVAEEGAKLTGKVPSKLPSFSHTQAAAADKEEELHVRATDGC